jgi:predicted nucleotidyltransferase
VSTKDFLNKIKLAVKSVDDDADLILFGSRARGDYKKDSDWDILILTKKQVDVKLKNNILDKMYDLELEHTQAISTMIVDRQRWEKMSITGFYENVLNEGKAL